MPRGIEYLGGFSPTDGTVEFYSRVRSILRSDQVVLDLGAGRGAWFLDDESDFRRQIRDIRPLVKSVIGADIDSAVLSNQANTDNLLIEGGRVPLEDESIDVIVADYVLEHVVDPAAFYAEVDRLLKPGGYFCARTPHRMQYVSLAARLVKNDRHVRVLARVQPKRKAEDTFPTAFKMNRLSDLQATFPGYEDHSYLYTAEPAYHFDNAAIYRLLSAAHRILPRATVSNLFVFLRKPE